MTEPMVSKRYPVLQILRRGQLSKQLVAAILRIRLAPSNLYFSRAAVSSLLNAGHEDRV
ncbi:MAG: hypothetical protein ACI91G_001310 [Gammaproteobacteria bacterium]|jgi:hypothetical protein